MSDLSTSVFRKRQASRTLVIKKTEDQVTEEALSSVVGEDQVAKQLQDSVNTQMNSYFAERYGEEVLPDGFIDKQINTTVTKSLGEQRFGAFEAGKRRKGAKKRMALQKHLLLEQKILLERRKEDRDVAKNLKSSDLAGTLGMYDSEEGKAAISEWLVSEEVERETVETTDKKTGEIIEEKKDVEYDKLNDNILKLAISSKEMNKEELNKDPLTRQSIATRFYNNVLIKIDDWDISEFKFTSDREFLSNYAIKYNKLCKGAAGEFFLDKYLELNDGAAEFLGVTKLRVKINMMKDLKSEYEDRMKLISSPYYALLNSGDLKKYTGKNGEEKINQLEDSGLQDYLRLYRKLSDKNTNLKGMDINALFQKRVLEEGEIRGKEDLGRAQEVLGSIEIKEDLKDKPDDLITDVYNQKVKKYLESHPKDDEEFLSSVEFFKLGASGTIFDFDSMDKYEKALLDITKTGSYMGNKIDDETLEAIKTDFGKFIKERRKFLASVKARLDVTFLTLGAGCDMQNPVFKDTEEGKKLSIFSKADLSDIDIESKKQLLGISEMVHGIFRKLHEKGYKLDGKYEQRHLDDLKNGDAVLEEARQEEIKKLRGRNKDSDADFQYTTCKVNDRTVTVYSKAGNSFNVYMKNKSRNNEVVKMSPEAEAALAEAMEYQKKFTILKTHFNADGGWKTIVQMQYSEDYKKGYNANIERLYNQLKADGSNNDLAKIVKGALMK